MTFTDRDDSRNKDINDVYHKEVTNERDIDEGMNHFGIQPGKANYYAIDISDDVAESDRDDVGFLNVIFDQD